MPNSGIEASAGVDPLYTGSPAVVALTSDQSRARLIELRDDNGVTLGYLLNLPDVRIFYTPSELASLRRRGAGAPTGKPLREVLDEAKRRASA